MKLKELMKKFSFKDYEMIFKDLYGNEHKKIDLTPELIYKIEELEVRNIDINFKLKKATIYLIGLFELLREV